MGKALDGPGPQPPPGPSSACEVVDQLGVDIGNPHLVGSSTGRRRPGRPSTWPGSVPPIEADYPGGLNVHLVRVVDPVAAGDGDLGAGGRVTMACGSGACAAAWAADRAGLVDGRGVEVAMPGGSARVEVSDDEVVLTGPAVRVGREVIDSMAGRRPRADQRSDGRRWRPRVGRGLRRPAGRGVGPSDGRMTVRGETASCGDHRGALGEFGADALDGQGGFLDQSFRERIVLVGVTVAGQSPEQTAESLDELELLVDTAGADALDRVVQRGSSPTPAPSSAGARSRRSSTRRWPSTPTPSSSTTSCRPASSSTWSGC